MANNMPMTVFVDADAFIALAKSDDSNHIKAERQLKKLLQQPVEFLTSNYVFTEVVTVLSQRVSHQAAVQFINAMQTDESLFMIRWIDNDMATLGVVIFKKQTSKNVSLVDCTNIALIQKESIDQIFSFDQIYRKNHIAMVA